MATSNGEDANGEEGYNFTRATASMWQQHSGALYLCSVSLIHMLSSSLPFNPCVGEKGATVCVCVNKNTKWVELMNSAILVAKNVLRTAREGFTILRKHLLVSLTRCSDNTPKLCT